MTITEPVQRPHRYSENLPDPELLIKQARRRTRLRRVKVAVLLLTSVALVVVLAIIIIPPSGRSRSTTPGNGQPTSPAPSTSNELSALAASSTNTVVLFAGRQMEVVAEYGNTACSSSVYLSVKGGPWHSITPHIAGSTTPTHQCVYAWLSASFVSPDVGWLLARNTGGVSTILEHTTDGGRTWQAQPGNTTGSNGGTETISFLSATVGFRQMFPFGSNITTTLQRTTDGGARWVEMSKAKLPVTGCSEIPDTFGSASLGFAASPLAGSSDTLNFPYLWRTTNGGSTWSKFTVVRPHSEPATATPVYGQATFVGNSGVLPVVYSAKGSQRLFFYVTTDSGATWTVAHHGNSFTEPGGIKLISHAAHATCGVQGIVASGPLVSVASAGPRTWWVLRPGTAGHSTIMIIEDEGRHVITHHTSTLPSTLHYAALSPASATLALVTVYDQADTQVTYQTDNAGRTWHRVTLP